MLAKGQVYALTAAASGFMSLHPKLTKQVACAKENCPSFTTKGDLCKGCRKKVGVAIKESDILKGTRKQNKGLFAARAFKKNEIVGKYKGEILTDTNGNTSDYIIQAGDGKDKVYIDANVQTSCVVRYVNSHQNTLKTNNCEFWRAEDFNTTKFIFSEHLPKADDPRLIKKYKNKQVYVVAVKAVEQNEEFLVDYGSTYHIPFRLIQNRDGRNQANLMRSNAKNTSLEDFNREIDKLYGQNISILDLKDNSFKEESMKGKVSLIRKFIKNTTSLTTLIMSNKLSTWSKHRFNILTDVETNTHLTTLDISNIDPRDGFLKTENRKQLRDTINKILLKNKVLLTVDLSGIFFFESADVCSFANFFMNKDRFKEKGLSYNLNVSGKPIHEIMAQYIQELVNNCYTDYKVKFTIKVNVAGTIKNIQCEELAREVFSGPGSSAVTASNNKDPEYIAVSESENSSDAASDKDDPEFTAGSESESSSDAPSDNEEQSYSGAPEYSGPVSSAVTASDKKDPEFIAGSESERSSEAASDNEDPESIAASGSDTASDNEEQSDSGALEHVRSSESIESSEDEDLDISDVTDKSPKASLAFDPKRDSKRIKSIRLATKDGKREPISSLLNYEKDNEVCSFCENYAYKTNESSDISYCKKCKKKGIVQRFFEKHPEADEDEPGADEAENEADIDKAIKAIGEAAKKKSRNQQLYPLLHQKADTFLAIFDNKLDERSQRLQLEISKFKQAKRLFKKYEAQVKKGDVQTNIEDLLKQRFQEYKNQLNEVQNQIRRDKLEIKSAVQEDQQVTLENLVEGYKYSDQEAKKSTAVKEKLKKLKQMEAEYAEMKAKLTTAYPSSTNVSNAATARRIKPVLSKPGAFVISAPPNFEKTKKKLKRKAINESPGASAVESSLFAGEGQKKNFKDKAANAFPEDSALPAKSSIYFGATNKKTPGAASAASTKTINFEPQTIKRVIKESNIIEFGRDTRKYGWTNELEDENRWMINLAIPKVLFHTQSTSAASVTSIAATHYETVKTEIEKNKRVPTMPLREAHYHIVFPTTKTKSRWYNKKDASTYSVLVPLLKKSKDFIMQFDGSKTNVEAKVGNIYVYRNDSTLQLFPNTSKQNFHYITYTFGLGLG